MCDVNLLGMGRGAEFVWIENETDHLPLGHFWSEIFKGRHLSVDYLNGNQVLCVEGFHEPNAAMYKWNRWERVDDVIPYPSVFKTFAHLNCEFIGEKLIEAHLRHNPDFRYDNDIVIPVWIGEGTIPPDGMRYVVDPDYRRQGFFVR